MLYPPFRRTTIHDASTLAEFVEVASKRLALYLWTKLAGGGREPWHIGRERILGETGGLHAVSVLRPHGCSRTRN